MCVCLCVCERERESPADSNSHTTTACVHWAVSTVDVDQGQQVWEQTAPCGVDPVLVTDAGVQRPAGQSDSVVEGRYHP